MAREYRTLGVPRGLSDRWEALIGEHPEFGYRNASEAMIEALREKLWLLEDRARAYAEARRAPPGDWERAKRGR